MTENIMILINNLRKEGLKEDLDSIREAADFIDKHLSEMEAENIIYTSCQDTPFNRVENTLWLNKSIRLAGRTACKKCLLALKFSRTTP